MKTSLTTLTLLASCSLASQASAATDHPTSNYLWYEQPAKLYGHSSYGKENLKAADNKNGNPWESEALPIGNGRIGAMVFGGDKIERLALNEVSLWTGGNVSTDAYNYGPKSGKNDFGAYQPFGDLIINFQSDQPTENYERSLDLTTGIAKTSYTSNGVNYTREVFASHPNQVIVMTCKADKAGQLNADFILKPAHDAKVTAISSGKNNKLSISGTLANGQAFEGIVSIIPKGGTVTATGGSKDVPVTYQDRYAECDLDTIPKLILKGGTECTVILSMATDYVMDHTKNWKGESPQKRNNAYMNNALATPIADLKNAHIKNYKSLFDRLNLNLGKTDAELAALPTDKRLEAYKKRMGDNMINDAESERLYTVETNDPELEETLFQYGRYMLISGSRPGNLPANLQGIWNDMVSPPWASDYHNNINIQMCYWGAEPANLSECHTPLINYINAMQATLRDATKKQFKPENGKDTRGWTVRTSQNIFGGSGWQWNIPGNAWYARHIWDHFAFTCDKNYLKNVAYPIMKEVSEFWEDNLKELGDKGEGFFSADGNINREELADIKKGTLVAPNAWSPEHGPREDGVSHDQQLIWDVFTNTITAGNILGTNQGFSKELADKRDRLAKPKIGKEGNLQEWMIDRIAKTDHRHTSHLYAVYPGNEISMEKTPELAKAARNSLKWRGTTGDSRRSWTWPWRTALWSRFKEGDRAHDMVAGLLHHNTLPNMIATHAPMQMDGTYGITGAMCEMLVQSHTGDFTKTPEISLLPAPAKSWPEGSVKGIKARGNVTIDFDWKDGKVTTYKLTSPLRRSVKLTVNGETKIVIPEAPKAAAKN